MLQPAVQSPSISDAVAGMAATQVVTELVAIVTRPLVAALAGVSTTRVVKAWEAGGDIRDGREHALRLALQAALIAKTRYQNGVVRNWFVGHNSNLGDKAPGELIAHVALAGPLSPEAGDLGRQVLAAARAFVTQ